MLPYRTLSDSRQGTPLNIRWAVSSAPNGPRFGSKGHIAGLWLSRHSCA
jgi:hypothetical protein